MRLSRLKKRQSDVFIFLPPKTAFLFSTLAHKSKHLGLFNTSKINGLRELNRKSNIKTIANPKNSVLSVHGISHLLSYKKTLPIPQILYPFVLRSISVCKPFTYFQNTTVWHWYFFYGYYFFVFINPYRQN